MSENFFDRVERRLAEIGLTIAAAGRVASSTELIRNWERALKKGRLITPKRESLEKLAAVLQVSVDWIMHGGDEPPPFDHSKLKIEGTTLETARFKRSRRTLPLVAAAPAATQPSPVPLTTHLGDIPVLGVAGGSLTGKFSIDQPIDYVDRPPGLSRARDAYAVLVHGESMVPEYRPGTTVYAQRGRPPSPGEAAIIETYLDGKPEVYIKIFKAQTGNEIICEQHNPKAEVRFRVNVSRVDRVYPWNEVTRR